MKAGLLFCLAALASPALAECPPVVDQSDRMAELRAEILEAPDEASARLISNQMWQIWATAPDEPAQEILEHGMERRSAYDFLAATEAFDRLIEYCPHYAEGYNQRAFVNFIRQDYESALADLELTLERAPDHIPALSGKALTLMGLGRMDEGQELLREALSMNPWLPERGLLIKEPGEDL